MKYRHKYIYVSLIKLDEDNIVKKVLKLLIIKIIKCFSFEKIIQKYINICSMYNNINSKWVCNVAWGVGSRGKIQKKNWRIVNINLKPQC